jgi:metal-responsive CopG/Arc/MetJ family transcriptional regulator
MGGLLMDYVGIKIPKELAHQIDAVIDSKGGGYSSRAEFVKEAIRQKLATMEASA